MSRYEALVFSIDKFRRRKEGWEPNHLQGRFGYLSENVFFVAPVFGIGCNCNNVQKLIGLHSIWKDFMAACAWILKCRI